MFAKKEINYEEKTKSDNFTFKNNIIDKLFHGNTDKKGNILSTTYLHSFL
jgi:hypothetical protein